MLKERASELNLSHTEIARRTGLKQPYVTQLINGDRTNPSIGVIVGMAKVLDVKPSELFDFFVNAIVDGEKMN